MRTAHRISRAVEARVKGAHLVAANQPSACRNCTGTCNEGRDCPFAADTASSTLRLFARVFGPYLLAVAAALLLAAAPAVLGAEVSQPTATGTMKTSLAHVIDALAAWAAAITPAQWFVIGLVLLLLGVMVIHAFVDCCLQVEELFKHHGVGRDDMAEMHERTWPEYWS